MTPKKREFARLYAQSNKVAEAARGAGYSEIYAAKRASILLNDPEVIAEVKRIRERLNQTAEKNATDVVNEFSKIAFSDRVDFLKEDPYNPGEFIYKSPDELTADQRAVVEKVTYSSEQIAITENGEVRKVWVKNYNYVFSDKSKALEQMGRHFGIFDDKLRLTGATQNAFKNVSPEQLQQLKESFVKTMNSVSLIEGTYEEVKNGR